MNNRNQYWKKPQIPYDSNLVNRTLDTFNIVELHDPQQKKRWVEFAKKFSQMNVTNKDVEELSFERYMALKNIMSVSLCYLSTKTEHQRKELDQYEKQIDSLQSEMKKLDYIETQNKIKEKQINKKIEQLKRRQSQAQRNYRQQNYSESAYDSQI